VTITKGAPWGARGVEPPGTVTAASDAQARRIVSAARAAGQTIPPLHLTGGDLAQTLGAPASSGPDDRLVAPADAGVAVLDDEEHWFVAHLVARRSWWRGRIVAVMNAQHRGPWDVAPRSHPNDGRLDVVDVSPGLSLRDRWRARRRLPTGAHVPHPEIAMRQVQAWSTTFPRPTPVWLDGERVGAVRRLEVRVVPDALLLVV
jgi:hypothetical protein